MNKAEFRRRGEEVIDYIVDYLDSVSERRVLSDVYPGYLKSVIPLTAPEKGESFEKILEDFERCIMIGVTHWQHPRFHAYFPATGSYPSFLAEMMADAIGCVRFDWNISPAGTDLECIVADWYGKLMGLPDQFLGCSENGRGGGIVLNSSSECVFITMVAARNDIMNKLKSENPNQNKISFLPSIIAYCSKESHSAVEKAAFLCMVTIRILETDQDFRLRGETLAQAINEDKKNGLVPFYVCITLGTTSSCACDALDEIGPVCHQNNIWLNVDAAYGGTALLCPEYKYLLKGIEYASSFNVNPAKWMLVNIDCAVAFATDLSKINDFVANDQTKIGYSLNEKEWCHSSNRRCRAFKLWFVMHCYGVEGLQKYIRNHVRLAELFANCVNKDSRFELWACQFGLVCFRLKGSNRINKKVLKSINNSGKIHMIASVLNRKYVIRFCVCKELATEDDINYAWNVICEFATQRLEAENSDDFVAARKSLDNFFS